MPARAGPKGCLQPRATRYPWHDTLLCLQLQGKIRAPLIPLTSGLTKGSPVLGKLLFCHPKPSCIAHSLIAEEHPGLGSSWTGAGSNTARDKSTGGILGRMMHHTGSGLLSFPSLCSLRRLNWDFGAAQLRCLLASSICLPQLILSACQSYHRERQACPGAIRTLFPTAEVRPTDWVTWPCWARHRAQARLPSWWQGAMAPPGSPWVRRTGGGGQHHRAPARCAASACRGNMC